MCMAEHSSFGGTRCARSIQDGHRIVEVNITCRIVRGTVIQLGELFYDKILRESAVFFNIIRDDNNRLHLFYFLLDENNTVGEVSIDHDEATVRSNNLVLKQGSFESNIDRDHDSPDLCQGESHIDELNGICHDQADLVAFLS